ncbi:helix-turn-helix domain-containing protein, partial [Butyrivibrio sp. VCB2006]
MSIRNAGQIIKEARINAGLSQEKLSDGICSLASLSNIENGILGVSPFTFNLLMQKAGSSREIYPFFENDSDWECFIHIKQARFYLLHWKMQEAYIELLAVNDQNFNYNRLYFQEWFFLYSQFQYYTATSDIRLIYDKYLEILPYYSIDISNLDFKYKLLTVSEINALLLFAELSLELKKEEHCLIICQQLLPYIENTKLTDSEKEELLTKYNIVYIKYLLCIGDYSSVEKIIKGITYAEHSMNLNFLVIELRIIESIYYYLTGNKSQYQQLLNDILCSITATQNDFFSYLRKMLVFFKVKDAISKECIINHSFAKITYTYNDNFSNGIFDIYGKDVLTIGSLIKKLRVDQGISQQTLCQGLCSKSMLSKIENCILNPDIIIAGALLNRLGYSERELVFYGNKQESQFNELKLSLSTLPAKSSDYIKKLNELKELAEHTKHPLIKQTYVLFDIRTMPDSSEKETKIKDAIFITLPAFDINKMLNYRLSWVEFSLINQLIKCINNISSTYNTQTYFQQIFLYKEITKPNIIYALQLYPVTYYIQQKFF